MVAGIWRPLLAVILSVCCRSADLNESSDLQESSSIRRLNHPKAPICQRPDPASGRPIPLIAGHPYLPGNIGNGRPATLARFRLPSFVALDEPANLIYVSDTDNNAVRMVDLNTTIIYAFAGLVPFGVAADFPGLAVPSGMEGDGGPATSAQLCRPHGLVVDRKGRFVYIADQCNSAVRAVSLESRLITTLVGRLGVAGHVSPGAANNNSEASFVAPTGLALDDEARMLYITDFGDDGLKVFDLVTLELKLLTQELNQPMGITLDIPNTIAYVACYGSHSVARVVWSEIVTDTNLTNVTLYYVGAGIPADEAGDGDISEGDARLTRLTHPTDVALFQAGQRLYIADSTNPSVVFVDIIPYTVLVAIARPGLYNYAGRKDVGPVGLALEESAVGGFTILYNIRSFDDKTYEGRWFYFDSSEVPQLEEGVHTVSHYRNGNLVKILHLKIYKHVTYMKDKPGSCPTCNAQGLSMESNGLKEFLIGDVIYMDYYFPAARQRLYMAEGHNQVVRYSDMGQARPWVCPPNWDQNQGPVPEPLEDGDDGKSGFTP